jgi:hypothetical protein
MAGTSLHEIPESGYFVTLFPNTATVAPTGRKPDQ